MPDNVRIRKLSERIHVLVASLLESRVKDPRLGFVTVTDVRLTNDAQHASVFYTVLGDEQARADSAAALASATGMIRSEVGGQLGLRLTPSLEFIPDALPEAATQVEDLLREAARRDAEVRETARHATPAGDPDPYRSSPELNEHGVE